MSCKKNLITIALVTIIHFSSHAFAYDLKHGLTHGHVILQLGGYWNTQGHGQHINIDGLIGDEFGAPTPTSPGSGLIGVGYFIDGANTTAQFNTNYGLNWFYLGPTSRSGTVTQENLYTNLKYHYKVTQYPLYAVAKAYIHTDSSQYDMVFDAGIGPNFMVTSHFSESSLDVITIPDQIFSDRTTTVFSATIGIGLKLNQVFGELPLECGYRFFYLGKGRFNALSDQINNYLNTGEGYANAVICMFKI